MRDYIHVSDLISAHVDALAHLRKGGDSGIFNCGYGKGYSVLEVINAVKKAHGGDFKVNMGPRRAGDPAAHRGRCDAGARGSGLAAEIRRSRLHRQLGAGLGTAPGHPQRGADCSRILWLWSIGCVGSAVVEAESLGQPWIDAIF